MENLKNVFIEALKKQWFYYEKAKSFGEGYQKGTDHSMHIKKRTIEELERLKNDHWDKGAFDRIIERLKTC